MGLQVVFIKKKFIYYTFTLAIILVLIVLFFCFRKGSIYTFNIISENKMIQTDLTGDGVKDILYIKTEKDKYYIQINSGDNSYYLEPSKKITTVGNYSNQWPLRLNLIDISRDNVPEIFTQGSINNKAISHVFLWNGYKFESILYNSNNILGFADSKNNKTPKVLSGNLNDGKISLVSYMLIGNNLKPFEYAYTPNYMGKDTILGFVKLISSLPIAEVSLSKELFSPALNSNTLSLIKDLSNKKSIYNFQDAVFKDYKWDKNGSATDLTWSLSFKETDPKNLKTIKNCTIELILKLSPNENTNPNFKISSINIK